MKIRIGFLVVILNFLISCNNEYPIGSKKNPIKLFFVPAVESDSIQKVSDELVRFLEKETSLHFKVGIPNSYIAVVEAFGSKRADIALINPFGYILANQKYGARAKLTVGRNKEFTYKGQIIVRNDSGIKTVSDLKNKKFAFTDPASTSGFMFPMKLLKENNIRPSQKIFAGTHNNVVLMVLQGKVDAGATYHKPMKDGEIQDARRRVMEAFPEVKKEIGILTLTDEILLSPFTFRKDFPLKIEEKVIIGIKKLMKTAKGQKLFEDLFEINTVRDATDLDYNNLRKTLEIVEINPMDLLKK